MRKFERLLTNVISGKVAKIEGSQKELQDAQRIIRNLAIGKRSVVGEKRITIYRKMKRFTFGLLSPSGLPSYLQ